MALSIKKSAWNPSSSIDNASPLQKGMWVEFWVENPGAANYKNWKTGLCGRDKLFFNDNDGMLSPKRYNVVLTDPIELNIETEWTESAGAEMSKKINQIFNSKAIKIFAGNKGSMHAPTDSWTQKTTESAKPLSAKLKFRIYNQSLIDETNNKKQKYTEMIRFLILLCAPRKIYSVAGNVIGPLIAAAQNSKEFFQRLKAENVTVKDENGNVIEEPGKNASESEKQEYRTRKEISAYVERTKLLESRNTDDGIFSSILASARYNFTLRLKSTIFDFNIDNADMDWYVKSFNWKPSTEIQYTGGVPYPLWVDFEVDLETCCAWPQEWIKNIKVI